jgi:hypothetical protein
MVLNHDPNESQTSLGATCAPKSLIGVVSACEHRPNGPILSLSRCIGNSRSRLRFETGSMTGWWAASSISTVSTTHSLKTGEAVFRRKRAVFAGNVHDLDRRFESPRHFGDFPADFGCRSLRQVIPFLVATFDGRYRSVPPGAARSPPAIILDSDLGLETGGSTRQELREVARLQRPAASDLRPSPGRDPAQGTPAKSSC